MVSCCCFLQPGASNLTGDGMESYNEELIYCTVLLNKCITGDQIKNEMGGACSRYGG